MKTSFLGSFITASHVDKACKLLSHQINQVSHSYNVLDFILYSWERRNFLTNPVGTHKELLEQDSIYNRSSCYVLTYLYPKNIEGVRECGYLSFEVMISYYSLGFYIYDLISSSNLSKRYSNKNYTSYYGYHLNFDQPEKSKIYYQDDYLAFVNDTNNFVQETIASNGKVLAIKLDIQDFFDSIDHKKLLEIINELAPHFSKNKTKWNSEVSKAIEDYLFWISSKGAGLPVSSQNIVSNYLSHLYLIPLDDEIINILRFKNVQKYKCARYVDDLYILIEMTSASVKRDANLFATEMRRLISSFLLTKLGLKLNNKKTLSFFIDDQRSATEFLLGEKLVSFGSLDKYFNFSGLPDYRDRLLKELKSLNQQYLEEGKISLSESAKLIINSVFEKRRKSCLEQNDFKEELDAIVKEMSTDALIGTRKSLYYIFLKFDHGYKRIIEYITSVFDTSTRFDAHKLRALEAIVTDARYKGELDGYINAAVPLNGGMMWLFQKMINKWQDRIEYRIVLVNNNCNEICSQVRLINLSYHKSEFAKVLNHIINLIQLMTCYVSTGGVALSDDYDRHKVLECLRETISERELMLLNNCYELRNANGISHPVKDGDSTSRDLQRDDIHLHINNINNILIKMQK